MLFRSGLYVPGAQTKRDAVRRELGEEPEHTHEAEKEARYCPECGQALFHHKSTRGKFSYIKSIGPVQGQGYMQQDVQVDRESGPWCIEHYAERPPLGFFGSSGGNLT